MSETPLDIIPGLIFTSVVTYYAAWVYRGKSSWKLRVAFLCIGTGVLFGIPIILVAVNIPEGALRSILFYVLFGGLVICMTVGLIMLTWDTLKDIKACRAELKSSPQERKKFYIIIMFILATLVAVMWLLR